MKTLWKLVLAVACLCVAATASNAQQTVPAPKTANGIVVDGNDWMSSSEREREVFLIGVENMIIAETAFAKHHGRDVPPVSDRITKATADMKLVDIESRITRWYETNPSRRTMPVMAVVWREMVNSQP